MNLGFLQGLAGAMGGLSQGLDDYREQKRLAALEYRNKQQLDMQAQQQEFERTKAAIEAMEAGDTVDVDLANRASRFGLQARFEKDPTTGSLRMKSRLEDQINQTRLADAKTTAEMNKLQFDQEQIQDAALKKIQQLGPEGLLALPREERDYWYQQAGLKGGLRTLGEEKQESMLNPAVISAQVYASRPQGGSGQMLDWLRLRDQAMQEIQVAQGPRKGIDPIPPTQLDEYVITVLIPRMLGMPIAAPASTRASSPSPSPQQGRYTISKVG